MVLSASIGNSGSGYGSGVSATLHNARLVGASGTIGRSATANITVDAAGGITGVTIIDPGSAYAIGQTMGMLLELQQPVVMLRVWSLLPRSIMQSIR